MSEPTPSPYDIRTLAYAEHFCVWAIRTSVACSAQCRTLMREFRHAFGPGEADGVYAYHALLCALGKGTRKVRIGRPGHIEMTTDEACLLSLLTAAQDGDADRFNAHARWIMGHDRLDSLYQDARRFTALLVDRGHRFRRTSASPSQAQSVPASPRLTVVDPAIADPARQIALATPRHSG